MYTLILTLDERMAFDWVGDRYQTGYRTRVEIEKGIPEGKNWDDEGEITFLIPESAAWRISELAQDEEFLFPCFSPELTEKMMSFLAVIV
jgi:hypothetical protein